MWMETSVVLHTSLYSIPLYWSSDYSHIPGFTKESAQFTLVLHFNWYSWDFRSAPPPLPWKHPTIRQHSHFFTHCVSAGLINDCPGDFTHYFKSSAQHLGRWAPTCRRLFSLSPSLVTSLCLSPPLSSPSPCHLCHCMHSAGGLFSLLSHCIKPFVLATVTRASLTRKAMTLVANSAK